MSRSTPRSATSVPGRIFHSVGGAGRNVAAALGRLGVSVALFARIGADHEGETIRARTQGAGVDTGNTETSGDRSDAYVSLLDPAGDLIAAVADMGAVESITPEDVDSWSSSLFSCSIIVADTNLRDDTLESVLAGARRRGVPVIVQISSTDKALRLAATRTPARVIVGNRSEYEAVLETVARERRETERDVLDLAESWCITNGSSGVEIRSGAGVLTLPAMTVDRIVDTTGSGDAFTAGLTLGLLRANSVEASCRYGLAAAAIALQSEGADIPGLHLAALEEILAERIDWEGERGK